MVGLIGVITVIIAFMDSFVAKHTNLMVMLAGGFADPLLFVKHIDGRGQVTFGNGCVITQIMNHELQNLPGLYHGHIVLFFADQQFRIFDTPTYILPCAGNI